MTGVAHSADAEVRTREAALVGACRVVAGEFGGDAVWNDAPHDWRLIEERPEKRRHEYGGLPGAPDIFVDERTGKTVRRWYCTRCRLVEETSG